MLRNLYLVLLRLHPSAFRRQFADGMLEIFDAATGSSARVLLAADGLLSLLRQWAFRAEFRRPVLSVAAGDAPADVPLFRTIDPYRPRGSALFGGGLLTVTTLFSVVALIAMGAKTRQFLIGVYHPSPRLLPVSRASVAEAGVDTVVTTGKEPEDPLRPVAAAYFRVIRVLQALDADQDLIISQWELATAPAALRKLDKDHDGSLTAEECGFAPAGMPPGMAARARREFMRLNPVLAALDSDHDGEISAAEIAKSYPALKTLDRNGDGSLTPDEVLPDRTVTQAAMLMLRLDSNGDGALSREECESQEAPLLSELLRSADRNGDGVVTQDELQLELRVRAERNRELERARRAAGFH